MQIILSSQNNQLQLPIEQNNSIREPPKTKIITTPQFRFHSLCTRKQIKQQEENKFDYLQVKHNRVKHNAQTRSPLGEIKRTDLNKKLCS